MTQIRRIRDWNRICPAEIALCYERISGAVFGESAVTMRRRKKKNNNNDNKYGNQIRRSRVT